MLKLRQEVSLKHWLPDCRVAVILILNSEVFVDGHGGPCIQPHLSNLSPDIANSGWRDYGNRQGTKRLLDIFSDLHIPISIAMNSYLIDTEPQTFDEILKHCSQGQSVDIIGHGLTNSLSAVKHLSFEEQVIQALNQIERSGGHHQRPTSWLSPGFTVPENSSKILVDNGIRMSLDATDDDVLYKLKPSDNQEKELIILPYSMETNDISLCMCRGYTGEQYAQTLVNHVEQLWSEAESQSKIVCFGLHTFIAGTPAKSLHLKKALNHMKAMPNVYFLNCAQLLSLIENK